MVQRYSFIVTCQRGKAQKQGENPSYRQAKLPWGHLLPEISVDVQPFCLAALYHCGVEGLFLVAHLAILEGEVQQPVFVGCAYVEEVLRINLDVAKDDVVALG